MRLQIYFALEFSKEKGYNFYFLEVIFNVNGKSKCDLK